MTKMEFTYKGKQIVIEEEHPNAIVRVDGREFTCHHHHGAHEKGMTMWMCDEAYFTSPDIKELARHFADYGYMFDDPGRIIVDNAGNVVSANTKKKARPKKPTPQQPDADDHASHEHQGGN